ncbi:hypothetical protein PJP08_29615, partial [Mycobacterium kansasii]
MLYYYILVHPAPPYHHHKTFKGTSQKTTRVHVFALDGERVFVKQNSPLQVEGGVGVEARKQ